VGWLRSGAASSAQELSVRVHLPPGSFFFFFLGWVECPTVRGVVTGARSSSVATVARNLSERGDQFVVARRAPPPQADDSRPSARELV